MKDPVVHDRDLNEAFRRDIPKKPEPISESARIPWVKVVPKFSNVRGVQITVENIDTIAQLHHWEKVTDEDGVDFLRVPSMTGDVGARVGYWILVANDDWNQITVCSETAFTRSYEVET